MSKTKRVLLILPPNPPYVEYDDRGITEEGVLRLTEWFKYLDRYKADALNGLYKSIERGDHHEYI